MLANKTPRRARSDGDRFEASENLGGYGDAHAMCDAGGGKSLLR